MNSYPKFFRSLLALAVLGSALALSGCDKAVESASIAPVEIDRSTSCELDGMLLADYPGPKAQIHYDGQAQPAFFCDTTELLNTLLAGEQVRAIRAVYVQDMAQADWDHPEGHWTDARSMCLAANATAPWAPPWAALPRRPTPSASLPTTAARCFPLPPFSPTWWI